MVVAKPTVMLVDDSKTSRTYTKAVLSDKFNVHAAGSGQELFEALTQLTPDVILLDIEMPGMNGYDVIKRLMSVPEYAKIPVIFVSAYDDTQNELEGLSLGAVDYIFKPSPPALLVKRVESHIIMALQKKQLSAYNDNLQKMVEEKTQTIINLQKAVFELLTQVVEYRDDETGEHIDRTRTFYEILLAALQDNSTYSNEMWYWDTNLVTLSSQLHDIGKIAIRDSILLKPAQLTPKEFEEMKKHTIFGASIIERIERNATDKSFINHAKRMALHHHEKWDGSGYPYGLTGKSIPLEGRIMAIVDVYDALISQRPYKKPFSHEQAVQIIIDGSGKHFDPNIVRVFRAQAARFQLAGTRKHTAAG